MKLMIIIYEMQRNQVLEAIENRRSVRSYKPEPIPRDILNTIIEAGDMAPTGRNRQPWRFVVVEDPEFRRKLLLITLPKYQAVMERWKEMSPKLYELVKKSSRFAPEDPVYFSAPVILFVIGTEKSQTRITDCSLASQNIMLAAHSLGIGSCMVWFGRLGLTNVPEVVEALELKEGETLNEPIVLGYPDHYPDPPPKKPPVVKWI